MKRMTVASYPRVWLVGAPKTRLLQWIRRHEPSTELHHVPNANGFQQTGFGAQRDVFVDPLTLIPPSTRCTLPPSFPTRIKSRLMITTLDLAAAASDPVARRTLASLSLSVAKSKRIVVVTGAGISCSCGIPVS